MKPGSAMQGGSIMKRWLRRVVGAVVLPMLGVSLFALATRDGEYRTDLPPPTGKETYAQVMPASIGDEPMEIQPLPLDADRFHGARARYGSGASIEIVQARLPDHLDAYVAEHLRPRLQTYEARASAKINGRWSLRGNGENGRLYGWQNQNWLFVIEAASDELFDEAVDRFAYIRRE
jgi:hypothetical protein